jgi:hypothetical protein
MCHAQTRKDMYPLMNQLWHLVHNYMAMTNTTIDDLPNIAAGTYDASLASTDEKLAATNQEQESSRPAE